MKIVMVAPFGLKPKGTVRVRALPLAQALVQRGHEVVILVPPWDDRAAAGQSIEVGGVRVRQLPLPRHAALDLPSLTLRLLRAALDERPDLLHVFKPKALSGFVGLGWWLMQRLPLPRAPLIMDSDDWEGAGGWNDIAPYSLPQKWLFGWQEQWGLRHADGVTVASRTLESIVLSLGVPQARVAYLPNGPGDGWPAPDPTEVARLREQLGLGDAPVALLFTRFFEFDEVQLARRWARIVREMGEARLLVVGKGLYGEEVSFRAALAAEGVGASVVEVGWLPFEALPAHFAVVQVALYPMRDSLLNRTKCPVKLADTMQVGLPVVGEAVGQVAEYLAANEGGILVPPGDDDAFVAATLCLLRDADLAHAMGQAGQARLATHFAWPHEAARAEALYERVLAGLRGLR